MILVNAHDLHKAFASKDLFSGISFGIEEGDKIGLIGPNGTGKSTLLRILGGFIPQDQGSLTKKKGLKLGYLEQNPQFEASETILSSLLKVNDPSFTDETDLYSKAYSWMGKLELDQFGENFLVKKLSGGWQKKLALARELVKEPELLLL
ncbi:MAG: ABC-F family ATP-binding cassette domain-containing protein, partial [Bdellovibrionales bacterium]|nr:ABC-F family ATP-binding cassette domain-containing protein [Bdellovibrionales bacterium]